MKEINDTHRGRTVHEREYFQIAGSYSRKILVINPLDIISDSQELRKLTFNEFCYHLLIYMGKPNDEKVDKAILCKIIEAKPPTVSLFIPQELANDIYNGSNELLATYRELGLLYSERSGSQFIYPLKQIQELFS